MRNTYRPAYLATLPTISSAQADDLKIEETDADGSPVLRVWLSRLGPADGYRGPRVTVERKNEHGNWVVASEH